MKKYSRHIFVSSMRSQNRPHFTAHRYNLVDPVKFHWHDFYEIELVLSGSGTVGINNDFHPLKRGLLTFVALSDIHSATADADSNSLILTLSFDRCLIENEIISDFIFNSPSFVIYLNEEEITRFIQLHSILNKENKSILPLSQLNLKLLLESQLITLMKHQEKYISAKTHTPAIQKAIDYINKHYTENITLSEVAEYVFLSDEHLSREFKKTIGDTFKNYLTSLRIRHAKGLLTSTNNSIADIAQNSGFNSVSHFSSVFKKIMNVSPFEYRITTNARIEF